VVHSDWPNHAYLNPLHVICMWVACMWYVIMLQDHRSILIGFVTERSVGGPHILVSVLEKVVRLSKTQHRTCLPRASRLGDVARDGLKHDTENPPLFNT
jgi:hypothetical protein